MSKKYIPSEKEKYMCEKHKVYFKKRLTEWRNEIVESNSKGLYLNDVDQSNPFSTFNTPDASDLVAPRMAYFGSEAGRTFASGSPAERRFYETSFDAFYDDYLGFQKRQMGKGIPKEQVHFTDYLETNPFQKKYDELIPSERGEFTARYNPRARHIYF